MSKDSKKHKAFNFCVGRRYPAGPHIGLYMDHNCENWYGTLKEAKAFRDDINKKNPDEDYRIFMLVEIPE
jgi:hypothetical protein